MRVGVISDTHDRLPTFRRAMALFRQLRVDAVFHAGDFVAPFAAKLLLPEHSQLGGVPVHCVLGNNDGEVAGLKAMLPQLVEGPLRVEIGGRVIVMHHFVDWLKPADVRGADIVITGHTHEVVNETVTADGRPRLMLNPGECCGWVNDRCTVALLDTEKLEAEIVEVHP
ncbi:metallophosphoesterase [Mucisphaera sp.]|uniref:metallophosphoesterase n=1 Tax=Mucisphaera sp. TaxID=2913024 RepID=UPI003D12DF7D